MTDKKQLPDEILIGEDSSGTYWMPVARALSGADMAARYVRAPIADKREALDAYEDAASFIEDSAKYLVDPKWAVPEDYKRELFTFVQGLGESIRRRGKEAVKRAQSLSQPQKDVAERTKTP